MERKVFRGLFFVCCAFITIWSASCSNSPKQKTESTSTTQTKAVKDPARDEYVKFLDHAAAAPITEYDLFDGFRFDMTKKQVSARQSKYKKKEKDFVLVKMNGKTYTSSFEGRYLDDKLYDLGMTIFSIGDGDYKPLSRGDLNSLIDYFKSKYNGYTYLYVGEPVVTGPTYLWNKNNMIVKVAALYAGSDINSVTVEFENYPIIRGISKKLSEKQMAEIRKRAEIKVLNIPVVGMFVCKKTNDKYVFNDDGTGYFFTGGTNTDFKWSFNENIVTIEYKDYGKEHLLFDAKRKTLKENSESYGILVFEKI